ncbi:MAG TPA: hypothetical protein VGH44_01850 [Candidatus Saccharimonadia bacterium]|jgi:hypothetical protein
MAKKKNQPKKHKFKYTDAVPAETAMVPASPEALADAVTVAPTKSRQAAVAGPTRDFSYVSVDLGRIAVLAVVLVGLELVLWLLFTHTGVGNTVYNLVNV